MRPSSATFNVARRGCPRFTLVSSPEPGGHHATKNLWALGNYSRFIRPGMRRVGVARSDGLDAVASARKLMASAYLDEKRGRVVVVLVNYEREEKSVRLQLTNVPRGMRVSSLVPFVTAAAEEVNLARRPAVNIGDAFTVPAQSITTLVSYAGR